MGEASQSPRRSDRCFSYGPRRTTKPNGAAASTRCGSSASFRQSQRRHRQFAGRDRPFPRDPGSDARNCTTRTTQIAEPVMKFITLLVALVASAAFAAEPGSSNTIRAVRVIHFDASPQKRSEIIDQLAGGGHDQSTDRVAGAMLGLDWRVASHLVSIVVNPPTND